MKVILNVAENYKPNENDLFIYKNGQWCVNNFECVCYEYNNKIKELEKEFNTLKDQHNELKKSFSDLQGKYNKVLDIIKENIEK